MGLSCITPDFEQYDRMHGTGNSLHGSLNGQGEQFDEEYEFLTPSSTHNAHSDNFVHDSVLAGGDPYGLVDGHVVQPHVGGLSNHSRLSSTRPAGARKAERRGRRRG